MELGYMMLITFFLFFIILGVAAHIALVLTKKKPSDKDKDEPDEE